MQACDIKPDGRSFSAAISLCRGSGLWELAFEHVRDMAQAKAQYDPVVFSAALGAAGQQRWEVASDSLTSLQQLLGGVDVVAFGAAVGAVASTGTWPLALHTTTSMAIAQVSLNSRVLTPLLSACDAGLVWSKALQYLHAAPIVCIRPATETRNAAATACGHAGCWSQALAILKKGLGGVRPDPVAHRIAVQACTAVSAWMRALHLGAGGQAAERARRWQVALALLRATPCGDEDLSQRAWALAKSPESARPQTAAHASSIRQEAFEITESALQAMNTFQASELASLVWSLASITCAEPRLLAKSFEHLLQNHRVRGLPFRELASLAMSSAGSCFDNCASSLQAARLFQAVQDELISQATSSQLPAAPAVLQDLAARVLDTVWACQFSGQLGRRTIHAARTLLADIGSRFSRSVSLVSVQPARQGDPVGPGFPHVVLELGDRCVVYKPPSFWQVDDGKDEPQDASLRLSHFTQAFHPPRCWPILEDRSHSRGFLHRLDIPTSGLILTAKTHCAFYDLRLQLSLGQMKREYCVLSHGFAPFARSTVRCRVHWFGNGRQAASIVAAAGRPASSKLKVLGVGHFTDLVLSLLAIHILTGRQHQIRLQMSHVGHPTVSDKRYFSFSNCLQDLAWCPRNFLHRYRLTFLDGDGRPAEVREPLPCDLRGALGQLRPDPGRSEAAFRSWMAAEPPKAWSELASLRKGFVAGGWGASQYRVARDFSRMVSL
ncbi:rluD [Symbiodinium sp. CCMP2592]|nr:rluD [Symbiodinium sp. CCMP2592]